MPYNEENGKILHPAGVYDAVVRGHSLSRSTNGTPTLVVKFETPHGVVRGRFYLSDKASEHTMKKLSNMGFAASSLTILARDPDYLCGNTCEIVVKHREYEGEVYDEVAFVNSPFGGGGGEPLEGREAEAVLKKYDALLHKVQKGVNKAPDPAADKGDAESENEVPF